METETLYTEAVAAPLQQQYYKPIKEYYNIAGPDYEAWSKNFNMHFGYCKKFTDIFNLEKMLYRMNDEVLQRLHLPLKKNMSVADMGCGVGTVARYGATKFPAANFTGITIADYQLQKGNELIAAEGLLGRVRLVKDNFEALHFEDESFDRVYAIESACHAGGSDKILFIAEMAKVLKAGGNFCIADGFLKHNRKLPWLFQKLYNKITACWALPCFGNINDFKTALIAHGLTDIKIEEISWRIAPSVAYVPFTCVKFFLKELWRHKTIRLKKERWNNVVAPVLGMILGLYRSHFGYYIISGKK
jgi:MPBQ/MSBQ methyltransferase